MKSTLPQALLRVAPALSMVEMPEERRATCATCAMAPRDAVHATHHRTFSAVERCCTYNPFLPNFVVGRILRRGDDGARSMLARLRTVDDGITAQGVGPSTAASARYSENLSEFGRFVDYRCPYWRGGEKACSIWRDRNAVCRTWHCKYVNAAAGMDRWNHLREALYSIEVSLAGWCAEQGPAPALGAPSDEWVAWFLFCAERVAEAEDAALLALADEDLRTNLAPLLVPLSDPALPDILMASVREWTVFPDRVELCGYSLFDGLDVPPGIFSFLSRFDGRKTWQAILAEWAAEHGPVSSEKGGEPEKAEPALCESEGALERPATLSFDRGMIEAMFRLGVLSAPTEREVEAQPGYHVQLVPRWTSRPSTG